MRVTVNGRPLETIRFRGGMYAIMSTGRTREEALTKARKWYPRDKPTAVTQDGDKWLALYKIVATWR